MHYMGDSNMDAVFILTTIQLKEKIKNNNAHMVQVWKQIERTNKITGLFTNFFKYQMSVDPENAVAINSIRKYLDSVHHAFRVFYLQYLALRDERDKFQTKFDCNSGIINKNHERGLNLKRVRQHNNVLNEVIEANQNRKDDSERERGLQTPISKRARSSSTHSTHSMGSTTSIESTGTISLEDVELGVHNYTVDEDGIICIDDDDDDDDDDEYDDNTC